MALSLGELPFQDGPAETLTTEVEPEAINIRNIPPKLITLRAGSVYVLDETMAKALWRAGYGQYVSRDAGNTELILRPSEASFAVEHDGFLLQCDLNAPVQVKDWNTVLADYIIFKQLRLNHGLYPRNGIKFGCDYTVYRVPTPEQAHSDFLLQVVTGTSTGVASLCELAHRYHKSVMLASLVDGEPVVQVLDVYLV
ncbi:TRNA splicing endonuclease [Giardia duodenalis]|uniref:tRNA-intron lyase n=1 Tax=Giardia intestinalis TaxID=5741 RepID=V6TK24_GIAIN|nr:TRNA splicing endonuclease [Giardia intestinalis]